MTSILAAAKSENLKSSKPDRNNSSGIKSGAATAADFATASSVTRRATGPRTLQGKERSKHNALKHGIFSKVVVLKGESQAEFDALLDGLRNDLQPEGSLEEVLVEKIAALLWRNRRLLIAEAAEIRVGAEFVKWDGEQHQREDAASISRLHEGGLVRRIANPEALDRCLDLLVELKESVEKDGFDPEYDKEILKKLYGYHGEDEWQWTLYSSYLLWSDTAVCPKDEREQKGYASPQKCVENFLEDLKEEIKWLGRYKKEQVAILSSKLELESFRRNVPDTPQLDRLLRYEASLERAIDRALSQLERYQRMRLGHPVPPPINVNVSSS
jgi:hypothetical protein